MDITIHNALMNRTFDLVNIGIKHGKIVKISTEDIKLGNQTIDAQGGLVLPPFFEPHFHLDNPLLKAGVNKSGTLKEAIEIYAGVKKEKDFDTPDIVRRATETLRQALAYGVLWLRSHVDIDPVAQLRLLEGVSAVKEKFAGVVDVSIIAFPQMGMADNPEVVDLMYVAMENGADIVGGMPHGERDMDRAAKQIEIAFEIAKKYDADIDMHVDETDDPYWQSLELLAEKTIEENYQGRVVAGHCCSMAAWDQKTFDRIIPKVKKASINITSNVLTNLVLQGRGDELPVRRGIPRIADLLSMGINVTSAHDDMRNMFYPFGNMNPFYAANVAAHVAHLTTPDLIRAAFEMPSYKSAKTFRIKDYGIQEGNPANLVLLSEKSEVDVLRNHPAPTAVIREGKVLVQTKVHQVFNSSIPD